MAFDAAVHNMVLKVGNACNRHSGLDTVIECGYPPAVCAAAGAPGYAHAAYVHLLASLEIIQGTHAVPGLNTCGRIAATIPPPHFVPVRAVMNSFDLTQLEGIDSKADIAVPCEPGCMMLIADFISVADIIFLNGPVTTNIENRRRRFFETFRDIQVARYVKAGHGLIVNILDGKLLMLDLAGDNRFEVGLFGKRLKPKHLK